MSGFVGAWRVVEYVYGPEGELLGHVMQQRTLERLGPARVRVHQVCEPEARLAAHPISHPIAQFMARFRGEHVFELEIDGALRRYLGPAVRGLGFAHGDDAMTGRGVWPDFGYAFRSFSLLLGPRRQVTGGTFLVGSSPVARILGVAVPDADGELPRLAEAPPLDAPPRILRGTHRLVSPAGAVLRQAPLVRRAHEGGFDETEEDGTPWLSLRWEPLAGHLRVRGDAWDHGGKAPCVGIARRIGPALEMELVQGAGTLIEWLEVHDTIAGCLSGIRTVHRDGRWTHTEVVTLFPAPSGVA